jgi:hypothetical protein
MFETKKFSWKIRITEFEDLFSWSECVHHLVSLFSLSLSLSRLVSRNEENGIALDFFSIHSVCIDLFPAWGMQYYDRKVISFRLILSHDSYCNDIWRERERERERESPHMKRDFVSLVSDFDHSLPTSRLLFIKNRAAFEQSCDMTWDPFEMWYQRQNRKRP